MSRLFLSENICHSVRDVSHCTSLVARKFDCVACKPQRHRPASTTTQSDQRHFVLSLESTTIIITLAICNTVKPVLSGRSKIEETKILMTNGSLMKV